jgi:NAD(P)H-nitrite reductase large subunit
MERQFGAEVGAHLASLHSSNGVKLYPSRRVTQIKGNGTDATSVVLDDGTELACELVLVGAGVFPATKFLQGSGIEMDRMGGVVCNPFLQTSAKDVYAAGDLASYPSWSSGKLQRIEHYISAMD